MQQLTFLFNSLGNSIHLGPGTTTRVANRAILLTFCLFEREVLCALHRQCVFNANTACERTLPNQATPPTSCRTSTCPSLTLTAFDHTHVARRYRSYLMTRNRCTHAHIDADVAVGDAAGRRTERRPAESYGAVVAYKRRKMRQFEGRTANARNKRLSGRPRQILPDCFI